MKTKILRKNLKQIVNEHQDSIRKEVAKEALHYGSEDIISFFNDLLSYGCISGMVGSLIYYHDTHAFFIKYYDEIETLRYEYEKEMGEPIQVKGDLMNFYAWFSFEETGRKLVNESGIEI